MNYRIQRADCIRIGDTLYRVVIDVTVTRVEQHRENVTLYYTDGTNEIFHRRDLLFVQCPHRRYPKMYI